MSRRPMNSGVIAMKRVGVSDIPTRVVTYERDFVGVSALPFSDVSVDRIQDNSKIDND